MPRRLLKHPCGMAVSAAVQITEHQMNKEKPNDDLRQRRTRKHTKQTDEPWKGPVEKEQKSNGPTPDLEKWQETNTQ
jgi:hypothetical protein